MFLFIFHPVSFELAPYRLNSLRLVEFVSSPSKSPLHHFYI